MNSAVIFRGASVSRSGKGSSRSEGSSVQPEEAPPSDLLDDAPLLGPKLVRFRSLRRKFPVNFAVGIPTNTAQYRIE